MSGVEQAGRCREDLRFVAGKGRFVGDIEFPGMLHMHVIRSSHAHARIQSIDFTAAASLPGVSLVLTYEDLGPAAQALPLQIPVGQIRHPITQTPLAVDQVSYVGQPVAAGVAANRYIAEDAAELILVDYEPFPAVTDPIAALEPGSPRVHLGLDTNIAGTGVQRSGDPESAMYWADHRFEMELTISRGTGHPIETRGAVARWEPETGLTFFSSGQTPHRHKRELAAMLNLSDHQVRVITPDVGGSFGVKGPFYPEDALVAVAAMQTGQPVK